jgi:integrase
MNKDKNSILITNLIIEELSYKQPTMSEEYYDTYAYNADHLKTWLANKFIEELTIEFWNDFFDGLREKYSGSQVSQYKTVLNFVYKKAILDGLVSTNLVKNMYVGERSTTDKEVYLEYDVELLLHSIEGFEAEKALIQLVINTGLTIGELMALTKCDYDNVTNELLICKVLTSKSGKLKYSDKGRPLKVVKLNHLAINATETLIELADGNGSEECQVVNSNGTVETKEFKFLAIKSKNNKRYKTVASFRDSFFKKYCELVGVKYLPPSKLRDTAIVKFIESGATLEWVVEQVGHTDVHKLKNQFYQWIVVEQQNSTFTNHDNKTKVAANDPSFSQNSDKKDKFSFISFLKSLFSWGDKVA